jgi:hypothetical protein
MLIGKRAMVGIPKAGGVSLVLDGVRNLAMVTVLHGAPVHSDPAVPIPSKYRLSPACAFIRPKVLEELRTFSVPYSRTPAGTPRGFDLVAAFVEIRR